MMPFNGEIKTLFQCDFDGTVTEGDASFVVLDAFTGGDWRQLFKQYQEGKMSVGRFNTEAFSRVRADRESLLRVIRENVKLRPGFAELVACCRRQGLRLVIVSNGLEFYIEGLLEDIGVTDIEVFAARTQFDPEGLRVQYIGPDGSPLDSDFKEAYVDYFLNEGYRIIYAGNGSSDLPPAQKCHYIFATGTLLKRCQQTNTECTAFADFGEVVRAMEQW